MAKKPILVAAAKTRELIVDKKAAAYCKKWTVFSLKT
jgi:hypothetical protein